MIEHGIDDGPETRRVVRAGHQEALPSILRSPTKGVGQPAIWVMAFEVMKHLPAYHMLEKARREGSLNPGQAVVETSSGTFALGLARVCHIMGHPCVIAADRAIAPDLLAAIESRGAKVVFVEAPTNATNVQQLRKDLRDRLALELNAYVPDQYGNAANFESYRAAAEIACSAIGHVDMLVCTVGSGGSSRGLAKALREANCKLQVVGVDTPGSIIFGLPAGPRELRGLGNGLMPGNVDHRIFDAVHWVTLDIALEGVRRIEALGLGDRGLTSGAAWMVAEFVATVTGGTTLAVFPDLGWRYRKEVTAYRWRDIRTAVIPMEISHLSEARPPWCWLAWKRRGLLEVLNSVGRPLS